jgi:hypothetical protein
MAILIQYVAIYAGWIYAVCGLVALYQIYRLWQVRGERRQAVFSLEREKAVHELQSIFSVALILLLIMGGTYFTSTTLAEALGTVVAQGPLGNATPGLIPTPTNTPLPPTETPTPGPTVPFTLTLSTVEEEVPLETPEVFEVEEIPPTDTPVPPPPPPAAGDSGCPDPRSVISSPGNGSAVSGIIAVVGTANHEQFQYYKVEYAPAGTEGFNYLAGGQSIVNNGALITFDTTALPNGNWTLRLIVVDQTGNFPTPCQVTVQIQN